MSIEEFKYLWDGSEPKWLLQHTDHVVCHLKILFGEKGPSKEEILKLYRIVPELKSDKLTSVYKKLKGHSTYRTQESYGNIESRSLYTQASTIGLNVELESEQIGGYLPISKNNFALIMEDDNLAKRIVEKMMESGAEIVEVHID
jgi:hypothetical protein